MSTVKTNNVQIGQSVTATNNFTWYQPSTPDGTVRLGNGNSGSVTDLVTLTSAGNLGIGTSSPSTKLNVAGTGSTPVLFERTGSNGVYLQLKDASGSSVFIGASNGVFAVQTPGSSYSDKLVIDASGNLGLGVTPSAWVSGNKAFQIGTYSAIDDGAGGGGGPGLSGNAYEYSSGAYKYLQSYYATLYRQNYNGQHQWFIAPSGTAGNAISFTQAMTLDASGNLFVGITSGGAGALINAGPISNKPGLFGSSNTAGYAGLQCAHTVNSSTGYVAYFGNSGSATGLYISNTAAWQSTSDARLKEDVKDISTTEKLLQLRPVDYLWKSQAESDDPTRRNFGFIAQEMQEIFPNLVAKTPDGMFSIEYTGLIAPLVKAIQELSAELESLKAKVNA